MSANRRGFLHALLALPVVGPVLGRLAPSLRAAAPARRDVYKDLGVRPLINAAGTYTALGGSLMRPEVVEAMAAAARQFVPLIELQEAVGRKIAALVGCDAALVSAGAASALTLGTAACVAGKDPDKVRRLPDTTGMKNEVLIQKAHRYGYDHAVRNVGVRLVEVETRAELERAVGPRTAMMLFYNDFDAAGQIKVAEFAKLGKKLGVPTFNDAAAEVPPAENLTRYLKLGYDLVTFSGGKGLRGPQSAGLLLGRKDLIEAAALHNNPHTDSIGRTNKVGKEELVGMWAALKAYLEQDHAAVWREWDKRVEALAGAVTKVKGVKVEKFVPPLANHTPHLRITWAAGTGLTAAGVVQRLREGEPRVEVRPPLEAGIEVAVWMLSPEEVPVVGRRLREALSRS
jgi:L-seryl-tRNA(Ser) seleniumtransferase